MTTSAQVADQTDSKQQGTQSRSGRGRPRDAEKASAIIAAAGDLFMEQGFDGTSMDGVARRAGVSKQTVYSHFTSKEQLFAESVHATIADYFPEKLLSGLETHTVRDDLLTVCRHLMRLLMSDRALAMFRLLVASGARGSDLGQIFWDAGPAHLQAHLMILLKSWADAGHLDMADAELASEQLLALMREPLFFKMAIGVKAPLTEHEIEARSNQVVDSFLKLYGA